MKVSIIIVNFNTKKLTEQCINSIFRSTRCEFEIIVIDNSVVKRQQFIDKSSRVIVKYIQNKGFGNACNIGMKMSSGEFYLLLNPDTIVHKNAIDICIEFMERAENRNVGAVGCKTLLPNGKLDHNCKRGIPTPFASLSYMLKLDKIFKKSRKFGKYHATYLDENAINEVEILSGAFMLLRAEAVMVFGYFDEDFFMYGEDIDLCCKILAHNYKIFYLPTATITHLKGQSGLHTKNKKIIYHFHKSMILFYNKNLRKNYNIFVTLTVYCALIFKTIYEFIKSSLIYK